MIEVGGFNRISRWAWVEGARYMLGICVLSCRMKVECRSCRSTVEAEQTEPHGRARGRALEEHEG
jgi:ferredoxin